MLASEEALRQQEIDKVVLEVHPRVDSPALEAVEAFVRQFYSHIALEDLRARPSQQLAGMALSLWSLAETRQPKEVVVRVFNPTAAEHGWQSGRSVVELVNDDMPFLVDSVTAALNGRGLAIHLILHPIVRLERDAAGRRLGLAEVPHGADESWMSFEVDRLGSVEECAAVEAELRRVLALVQAAVDDFEPMKAMLDSTIAALKSSAPPLPAEEVAESIAFLEWVFKNFTFLGVRQYQLEINGEVDHLSAVAGSGLGILSDALRTRPASARSLSPEESAFARRPELLVLTKTNNRSQVHLPKHMDYVGVKQFDAQGKVVGELRFLGLFTSASYRQRVHEVPVLRKKAELVFNRAGFSPRSHDGKALADVVETYPRDELFQISVNELYDTAMGILRLAARRRIALFVRKDGFERFVACMVFLPKDRYDTDLRLRMERILARAFEGQLGAAYTHVTEEPLARIQFFYSTTPGKVPAYDVKELEAELERTMQTWDDGLAEAITELEGEERGLALAREFAGAFPVGYREIFSPRAAAADLSRIGQSLSTGQVAVCFYKHEKAQPAEVSAKVYSNAEVMPLADVLPLFENLGFRVLSERPFEIRPLGAAQPVFVRDFELVTTDGGALDLAEVRQPVEEAFLKTLAGEVENDAFNRLVLAAGLSWRQVVVLRAYARYLKQIGIATSQEAMAATLMRNTGAARTLVALFASDFDPDPREGAAERSKSLSEELLAGLDQVKDPVDDETLRRFLNLIRSTLRTNFYQQAESGGPKPYVSFKLDSHKVTDLPKPKPLYEVWVYSPRVEAIHLRGGKVARGGIRWSDRPEDFRTEVLGLVKAQMVKNAVIVPVGSKGGFVVKRPPAERKAFQAEGVECYKTLLRGLLDITDNYHGPSVVERERVVRRDGDDPYLVVAADKGTATFSDTANQVSAEYGHWLGDAFASGGSAGYDHKVMAITSRGAWESVKRHFREMGRDTQSEDFTCVGVGDMSGDVFGNGMLRSRQLKLLAAFDHRHVFVDPNPDAAASFEERQRLFDMSLNEGRASTWMDYDRSRISAGGGVFDRGAKAIPVSEPMRAALDLGAGATVAPVELMRAILKAEADLLWLGGIGTYIKSSEESHTDAKDRANNALRIDATELRAKVIGEGANLGMTQNARIEYAQHGGRINTDAIDNSGGVDCSDHEVNIKILLSDVVASGEMTLGQRDQLLEQMTDEVAELVLRDNYLQTQALSVAVAQGVSGLDRQARLIRELERAGKLERALEGLPDEEELASRQRAGKGLTRPELAVLLAYSKITLYEQILDSDLPDDAVVAEDLFLYFPTPLRERFPEAIRRHRLRREIIATHVTNSLVNRMGPTFVSRMQSASGRGAAEIAKAYAMARDVFDLRSLWAQVEELDSHSTRSTAERKAVSEAQIEMFTESKALAERATFWFLRHQSADLSEALVVFRPAVATLASSPEEQLSGTELTSYKRRHRRLEKQGVPEPLLSRVAALEVLASALDIVELARERLRPAEEVARVYFLVGSRFGFDWLREEAEKLAADTPWQREAKAMLVQELFDQQSGITRQVLAGAEPAGAAKAVIDAWAEGRESGVKRTKSLVTELKAAGSVDYAMLALARHQLALLVAG